MNDVIPFPVTKDERRDNERSRIVIYFNAYDAKSGALLGKLVDLTTVGLQLVCESAPEVEHVYWLAIEIPGDEGTVQRMVLEAVCRWCKPGGNPKMFLAGFQFTGCEDQAVEDIKALVRNYAFGRFSTSDENH